MGTARVTKPVILNETGVRIAEALEGMITLKERKGRVSALEKTAIATGTVINIIGSPEYLGEEKLPAYSAYGLTKTGWHAFCRITAPEGVTVTTDTVVEGVDGCVSAVGEDHIDVAIRFEVAAMSRQVVINWGPIAEAIVFNATDLAINNLDYRATMYVYPVDRYATWEFTLATDAKFVATKFYYVKDEEGEYSLAEVTADDPIPRYYVDEYKLTADTTFATGKTYYTLADGVYTAAEVTAGEAVPAYYVHSKVTFEGMTRNVTYVCNTPIDCPTEFHLPVVEDETHGCWFEIRFRHTGEFSSTLIVPEGVKVATEHTQPEKAGFNDVFLQYDSIAGIKSWRFLNTHSTIPA